MNAAWQRVWSVAATMAVAILVAACSSVVSVPYAITSEREPGVLAKVVPSAAVQESRSKPDAQQRSESTLVVAATQPSDQATDVDPASQIIVIFNLPVVPLVGVDAQEDLPNPITITPEVGGVGQWINTSVYVFRPDTMLAGATSYDVKVDNVAGLSGESLAAPHSFTFATAAPTVIDALPTGANAAPDTSVSVQFSQPMDPASTESAFRVYLADDSDSVSIAGISTWDEAQTTLSFTPTAPLEFGQAYSIEVSNEAQPAGSSGYLRESFTSQFTVAPYPDIVNVTPVDGAVGVAPESDVVIRFNTTVSGTQVLNVVSVSPVLTTTRVYSYYFPYNNELILSWFKEANTEYSVTVGGELEDIYGNTLGADRTFTFVTGDHTPFVNLELDRFNHFTVDDDVRVSLLYRNVGSVNVDLYHLPESEIFRLTGGNQWEAWNQYAIPNSDAHRVWHREYDTSGSPNVAIRQVITVTDDIGRPLLPGTYFLDVKSSEWTAANADAQGDQAAIVLSDANLVLKRSRNGPSLAWLTELPTGQPIPGSPVRFYMDGIPVGQGETGVDGTVTAKLEIPAENDWFPVIGISGEQGDPDYALVSSDWNSGIAAWDFGLNSGWGADRVVGYFYTDRPIYRPGDVVHWKGIIRSLEDDQYVMPPSDLPIAITVRDGLGNVIVEQQAEMNDMGTVFGDLPLSPEAGTGYYYLSATLGAEDEYSVYTGIDFQVASYREPEFELTLSTDKPEYIQGDTVNVTVRAEYFSGGPLADAPVSWRLIAEPYSFWWSDEEGRYYSFSPFDPDAGDQYDPYRGMYAYGVVAEGTGTTDATGTFSFSLPADLSRSIQSQNWAFDVTLQSPTNQFVSGRIVTPIHRAAYYIGLAPRSYVLTSGDQVAIDIMAVTPQGDAYPGAEVDVSAYEVIWSSVYEQADDGSYRWETSVERTQHYSTTVVSGRDGRAVLEWTPDRAGQFQVVAQGRDDSGNATSSTASLWVGAADDGEYVAWPLKNNDRIDIVADKASYAPGDVARILVPSPFQGPVNALVTQERAGVISSEVITLDANSESLEIPITEDHIPNVYISVVLAKGIDDTNPFPAIRVGYVMLPVDTSQKELVVDIVGPAADVRPGSTVTYTVRVADHLGRPETDAELSVAVVDKAVLSLAGGSGLTLLDAFYSNRPLDVLTGASLVINRDRVSQQLSEGAKGGGGGDGGSLEVRSDFSDVALWKADFRTDSNGEIEFQVDLPDSLTTWRLISKAVTEDTKVGEAISELTATKELQVRPLLPRFVAEGDRPFFGVQVINAGEFTMTGILSYTVGGADLLSGDHVEVDFILGPGQQIVETSPVHVVQGSQEVTLYAAASAAAEPESGTQYQDAIRVAIPVTRYQSPETVSTSGTVPPGGVVEHVVLPEDATDEGTLSVRVEPSLASGMLEGLDYLRHFPYECNEQTVSRFLPNLVTVRALNALEIEDDELQTQLSYQLGIGVQQLLTRQNPDGGWGYWPGEPSSPFITAYVLWGLSLAEGEGYSVPSYTLASAISYLETQFQAPQATDASWMLNQMAFMHYVLSELDAGDPGRASTLYDVREKLGHYGKALLAMALENMSDPGASDSRVQTLLDDIVGATVLSASGAHWEETEVDFQTLNTDTRSSGIILASLARLRPEHPILPQSVRWLMSTRESGRWSSTQETAWSIIGLTDWLVVSRELEGDYDWSVAVNGDLIGSGSVTPGQINPPTQMAVTVADLLRDDANLLAFDRTGEPGQLYYTTDLRYYLDATAVQSRDRGIIVGRQFASRDAGSSEPVSSAQVGDVLSVTVTIVAPSDLHQLLLEVPIPAGTEPIDPSLATTEYMIQTPDFASAKDGGTGWWQRWIPTYTDIRDDKVALFASFLPAGTYAYTFNVRASVPGEYRVLPARAEMMYFPDVWGRSGGDLFAVTEE